MHTALHSVGCRCCVRLFSERGHSCQVQRHRGLLHERHELHDKASTPRSTHQHMLWQCGVLHYRQWATDLSLCSHAGVTYLSVFFRSEAHKSAIVSTAVPGASVLDNLRKYLFQLGLQTCSRTRA